MKTGLNPAPPEAHTDNDVPTIAPTKLEAGQKIVIDGKGDDKAWATAVTTPAFVDVSTGGQATSSPVTATAKITWDDQNLYLFFDVKDSNVVGDFTSADKQKDQWTTTGQPKLWMKDTVEIMTDPDSSGDDQHPYYELQINPQNKVFHTQYDSYNLPKKDPNGPFGHEDWDPKLTSKVVVKGTMDKPGDKDDGYTVEAQIPWAAFDKAQNHPPKPGDVWRMNFYAMKDNSATSVAWSPILRKGNFHRASRFGKVIWTVPGQMPAAAPSAAPAIALAGGEGGAPLVPRMPLRPGMARGPLGAPHAMRPVSNP
jgi:hypothetical protein